MRRAIGVLGTGVLAVSMAVPAAAEDEPVPLATRLAARTHPSVQLISTKVSADVVVPYPRYDEGNLNSLFRDVARDAVAGRIPTDQRSLVKTALNRMVDDVDRYLKPVSGSPRVVKAETTALCTGWWVTPDGYMITGSHCVAPDTKITAKAFAEQAQRDLEAENKELEKAVLRGVDADSEMKRLTSELISKFNTEHLKLENLDTATTVMLAHQGGSVDSTARSQSAEVVSKGESYPGKDVAILKVSGQQNLPTLELGSDTDVQVGNSLYFDAFPGSVGTEETFTGGTKLQPAFSQGPYNAQRTTEKGVPYLQTQAPGYNGNSGGPVLNGSGRVVGILIATVGDGDGGTTQNEQLVLPVSVVKEKLAEKSIQLVPSTTSVSYNAALDLYFKQHYKKALPKFREVQNLSPNHPYVAKYIADSQTAITAGRDKTPMSAGRKAAIGGGAGAGVLLLAGAVITVVMIGRRRRNRTQAPAWQPAYPGQPPMYYQGTGPQAMPPPPPPPSGPPVDLPPPMGMPPPPAPPQPSEPQASPSHPGADPPPRSAPQPSSGGGESDWAGPR